MNDINDLLLISSDSDICSYADNTIYYAHGTSKVKVMGNIEKAVCNTAILFNNNYNASKCHLMMFAKNEDELSLMIGDDILTESKEKKLVGVIIDRKLSVKS